MTRLLVVSAHAADFVWRAGGAIAPYRATGQLGLDLHGLRAKLSELGVRTVDRA